MNKPNQTPLTAIFHLVVFFGLSSGSVMTAQPRSASAVTIPVPVPGNFIDTTTKSGINFAAVASHTSRKYLIETMGSGVAMFDYDNDGLLDIYLVNGAPLSDPTPKGIVPEKKSPRDWNRLYRQKKDGTFEDVTEKAGLQGVGYGMAGGAGMNTLR